MAIDEDLGGFDPYRKSIYGPAYLAYDPLVNLMPDGRFVSGLAEKWSADAHSATFTLRPDVTCSDGTPLTAGDVATAISYVGDPKNASTQYGEHTPTVPFTVTGDDTSRTVKIVMTKPFGFLLNTVGQLPIVCAAGMKNHKSLNTTSAGTGPFILTSAVPGQSYTFKVRKGYHWGPAGASTSAPGTPGSVVLRVIANATTRANLLLSGTLNLGAVVGQDQRRLDARGLKKYFQPVAGNWLWFNQIGGRPTADLRVRQALVRALDLPGLVKVNTGGTGSASKGLVSMEPKPCPENTVSGQLPGHDATAAATLLDQVGWTKGADGIRRKDGRPLTLDVHYVEIQSEYNRPTAELLAQQWRSVGAQVKLTSNTWTSSSTDIFDNSNYDVYTTGFGFNLPSQGMEYFSGATPPKGTNLAGIDNKDYNALAAKALTMTPPQACPYWTQAEQALYRSANPVPIADRPVPYYLNKAEARTAGFYIPVIPTSLRVLQ
jgi:peptide/nickel transport system substrate-binding protein